MNQIEIVKHSTKYRVLKTKSPFFAPNQGFIVKVDEDKISFTRPTLDYKGKVLKACAKKACDYVYMSISEQLPLCTLISDEYESNEDLQVFYFVSSLP